jgi:flagellar assembly protein FliH
LFTNSPAAESASMVETPPLRKYMFDRSFDGAAGTNAAERRGPVTLKPEQLDAVKKDAYDMGVAAGKKAALDEQEQFVRATLAQIEAKTGALIQNLGEVHKEQDNQLRQTVMAIARKLLPDLTERNGVQEIQSMLNDVIAEMVHEPRLVVRIHESEFDIINAKINEITVQKAYPGKVVVLADADIARGDCRVEWADGGIERNIESTWQAIEKTIAPETTTNETAPLENQMETTNG